MSTKKSKDGKPSVVGKSLADLGDLAKNIKTSVIQLGNLPDLTNLGATVEEQIATCQQISEGVSTAVKFIHDVNTQYASYTGNRTAQKIVLSQTAEATTRSQKYLDQALTLPEPVFCQSASLAYMKAILTGEFASNEQAWAALRELEERKLVVQSKNPHAKIMIGYSHYELAEVFGEDKEDLAEITSVIAQFSRVLKGLVAAQRQKDTEKALQASKITMAEVAQGAIGKCLFHVPKEPYTDRENKIQYHAGGDVLVEVTEDAIIPIVGIGAVDSLIQTVVGMGITIPIYQLKWEAPPGYGPSFSKVQTGVMRTMRADYPNWNDQEIWENSQNYVKKLQAFWYVIMRAIKAHKAEEAVKTAREEYLGKATITAAQLFELDAQNPQKGQTCLEYDGCFKSSKGEVYHLFFLASNDKEENKITIEQLPEHVDGFLGEFVGKSFTMDDCPASLAMVMNAIRGQVELAAELAKQ